MPFALRRLVRQSRHGINRVGYDKIPRFRIILKSIFHHLPHYCGVLCSQISSAHIRRPGKTSRNDYQLCAFERSAAFISVYLQINSMSCHRMTNLFLHHCRNIRRDINERKLSHASFKSHAESHLPTCAPRTDNCYVSHNVTSDRQVSSSF